MSGIATDRNLLSCAKQSSSVPLPLCLLEMLGASEGHFQFDSVQGPSYQDGETQVGEEEAKKRHRKESEGLLIKEAAIGGTILFGVWNRAIARIKGAIFALLLNFV